MRSQSYFKTLYSTLILMRLVSIFLILQLILIACTQKKDKEQKQETEYQTSKYTDLVSLFYAWRDFEEPTFKGGAPDYTKAGFASRWPHFKALQDNLMAIDTAGWKVAQQIDWMIVWAEMNGYDFNHRILKPWERDPAFYKSVWTYRSDVPAHEGPTHHATTELWTYDFPLSQVERKRLIGELKVIPPLNEQAKQNLIGNAKELWIAGIRSIEDQIKNLESLKEEEGVDADAVLIALIDECISSIKNFSEWLRAEADSKTGPSGIGKENYNWYLQNVHLVPLTWEDEVMILKRELARAWTALKLEEHRNRRLAELKEASSAEAYDRLADQAATSLIKFLDQESIVSVKPYFEPALRAHLGKFIPKEKRNFFYIGSHFDPRPLFSHFYHWFELARMDIEPHASEIRRGPLLYNIFDSRNEGTATAVEEMFLQAGLYDDSPRSREIVYIMIAQRAARGLGSLYAHANEMTMEEAGSIHSEYTPRGWMKTEKDLLIFEQHLYLRQPGYGTSYISGKYLLEMALAEYARNQEKKGEDFVLQNFMDTLNRIGNIPISLGHWQMTGNDEHLNRIRF